MGRMQRQKGLRFEYVVRDKLREAGWDAYRVPSSGAAEGFKGDVVATKGSRKYVFECKSRQSFFRDVYSLYTAEGNRETKSLRLRYPDGKLVALASSLEELLEPALDQHFYRTDGFLKASKRGANRLRKMEEWVKGCDFLVIKDNRQWPLWIRYYK